jgi:hypothetical protein
MPIIKSAGVLHFGSELRLDLSARPFAEQHAVARLQIDWDELAGLVPATWTDGDHLSLRRLLFGGIRNDDSTCGLVLGVDARLRPIRSDKCPESGIVMSDNTAFAVTPENLSDES